MASGHDEATKRWRQARAARLRARDDLLDAELDAGVRQRISGRVRAALAALAALAVLAVVGAGLVVWQARSGPEFSDQQLVDAATERVARLLSVDADDADRAADILAGATGEFHDSFAQSAESYTEYTARRGTRGTAVIDAAALADRDEQRGVVLVSASLTVAEPAAAGTDGDDADERGSRLRLRAVVESEGGVLKLAGVTFLP